MKKATSVIAIFLVMFSLIMNSSLSAQPYYEGYETVGDPYDPYDPSAPVSGVESGISYARIGLGLGLIAGAVAIIVVASTGSSSHN